jgi:predicted site-specific integrase-resolvase
MRQDVLLTPREAAELVGVQPATVRRWVREGNLTAPRLVALARQITDRWG